MIPKGGPDKHSHKVLPWRTDKAGLSDQQSGQVMPCLIYLIASFAKISIVIILTWCVCFIKFVFNEMDVQQTWAGVMCQCSDAGWFLGLCAEQFGVSMGPTAHFCPRGKEAAKGSRYSAQIRTSQWRLRHNGPVILQPMESLCSHQVSLITGWHLTFDSLKGDHTSATTACPVISAVWGFYAPLNPGLALWEQARGVIVAGWSCGPCDKKTPQTTQGKMNLRPSRQTRGHHDAFTYPFIFGNFKIQRQKEVWV